MAQASAAAFQRHCGRVSDCGSLGALGGARGRRAGAELRRGGLWETRCERARADGAGRLPGRVPSARHVVQPGCATRGAATDTPPRGLLSSLWKRLGGHGVVSASPDLPFQLFYPCDLGSTVTRLRRPGPRIWRQLSVAPAPKARHSLVRKAARRCGHTASDVRTGSGGGLRSLRFPSGVQASGGLKSPGREG